MKAIGATMFILIAVLILQLSAILLKLDIIEGILLQPYEEVIPEIPLDIIQIRNWGSI